MTKLINKVSMKILLIKVLNLLKTNFSKAETLFLKAITIKNKEDSAYINLANTYLLSNNLKQAKELLFDYLQNYKFQKK